MDILDILLIFLLVVLFVFLDELESEWEERKWQRDQLDTDSASHSDNPSNSRSYRRASRAH